MNYKIQKIILLIVFIFILVSSIYGEIIGIQRTDYIFDNKKEINSGDHFTLRLVDNNFHLETDNIIWKNSDSTIINIEKTSNCYGINDTCYLKAIKPGNAIITATTAEGLVFSYNVNVIPIKIQPNICLYDGSDEIEHFYWRGGLSFKPIPGAKWISSDNSIIQISQVYDRIDTLSVGVGKVTISAIKENGETATIKINVLQPDLEITDEIGRRIKSLNLRKNMTYNVGLSAYYNYDYQETMKSLEEKYKQRLGLMESDPLYRLINSSRHSPIVSNISLTNSNESVAKCSLKLNSNIKYYSIDVKALKEGEAILTVKWYDKISKLKINVKK